MIDETTKELLKRKTKEYVICFINNMNDEQLNETLFFIQTMLNKKLP